MDKIKVLIVDDDAMLGATITLGLEAMEMQPVYQTSLAGLQAVIKSANPNIILLDVKIGKDNGIEQMQQLKLFAPNIPIIFMSSHVDEGYVPQAINQGAVAFLKKPFDLAELSAYIKRFAKMDTLQNAASSISIGPYTLDLNTRQLAYQEKNECRLTAKQFQVIRILLEHKSETVSRQMLRQELWPDGNASDPSLDNYISQLRKIFAKDSNIQITTIPKIGIKLEI